MNKVGIVHLCKGDYSAFWKGFYESCEKFFLNNSNKQYYVVTDIKDIEYRENDNVSIIQSEAKGFPLDVLMRYNILLDYKEELGKYDYIFIFNSNIIFRNYITEEEFLPQKEGLYVSSYPSLFKASNLSFPSYERNPYSEAYIPYGKGKICYQANIIGGKVECVFKYLVYLNKSINNDLENGIIPKVLDETYLNKYLLNVECKTLGTEYNYNALEYKEYNLETNEFRKNNKFNPKIERLNKYLISKIEKDKFRKIGNKAVIIGASKKGKIAYEIYKDDYDIVCFLDNNDKLQDTKINNIPIYAIEKINELDYNIIIVASQYAEGIIKQLNYLGVNAGIAIFDYSLSSNKCSSSINKITKVKWKDKIINYEHYF